MCNYVSLIRRSDFNDLYRFGHLYVHNVVPFEGELSEHADDKSLFDAVTAYMNTYEYSTEYLILHFNRYAFSGTSVEIFIKDVVGVYALDKDAQASLSASLDPRISLQVTCWTRFFMSLSMKHSVRQSKAGMFNCFEIFGITEDERKRVTSLIPHNFVEDLFVDLFSQKRPEGDKSIWTYLLRYERHHPYWNDMRGYFSDAIHVFENFKSKHEFDYEIADEVPLGDKLAHCGTNFSDIYRTIMASNPTQYSVEGCNYFAVASLYLYMHGLFKEGGITVTKLRQNAHLIQEIQGLIQGTSHEQYGLDFALAVALLGIKLGQELTYSCYYEVQRLGIFNRMTIRQSKLNKEEMPLADPIDGKRLSLDEAQDLLNSQYVEINKLNDTVQELEQKMQQMQVATHSVSEDVPQIMVDEPNAGTAPQQNNETNEGQDSATPVEQETDTNADEPDKKDEELKENVNIGDDSDETSTSTESEESSADYSAPEDVSTVTEPETHYSPVESERSEGTESSNLDEEQFEPVLMKKPKKRGKGFCKDEKYAHDKFELAAFKRDGYIIVPQESEMGDGNTFKFDM